MNSRLLSFRSSCIMLANVRSLKDATTIKQSSHSLSLSLTRSLRQATNRGLTLTLFSNKQWYIKFYLKTYLIHESNLKAGQFQSVLDGTMWTGSYFLLQFVLHMWWWTPSLNLISIIPLNYRGCNPVYVCAVNKVPLKIGSGTVWMFSSVNVLFSFCLWCIISRLHLIQCVLCDWHRYALCECQFSDTPDKNRLRKWKEPNVAAEFHASVHCNMSGDPVGKVLLYIQGWVVPFQPKLGDSIVLQWTENIGVKERITPPGQVLKWLRADGSTGWHLLSWWQTLRGRRQRPLRLGVKMILHQH